MAAAETTKADFLKWMAEFRLAESGDLQEQRWSAIGKLADGLAESDIETLLRLALVSRTTPSQDALAKLSAAFQETDPTFTPTSHKRELQVLSAILLVRLATGHASEMAALAALSLTTSLAAGTRKPDLPLDLRTLAERALSSLAHGVGRRPGVPAVKAVPKISFDPQNGKVPQVADWTTASQALTVSGGLADAGVQNLASQLTAITNSVSTILQQQDEELQMLWWLVNGQSEDIGTPFAAVPAEIQSLIFAKELANHTTILPGPPSIRALLLKAGLRNDAKVGLEAALNACSPEWLEPLGRGVEVSPVAHPIHFAIVRQRETGPGPNWAGNWAAVTELPKDFSLTPIALAEQFYRERLILQRLE